MSSDEALSELQEAAIYWSAGDRTDQDVVDAACDALVAGHDSQALRELAGVLRSEAQWEVRRLLPVALDELGLEFFEQRSPAGQVAALELMARYCVAGTMPPRALATWANYTFGHGATSAVAAFAAYEHRYDVGEYSGDGEATLDEEVIEACRRLLQI